MEVVDTEFLKLGEGRREVLFPALSIVGVEVNPWGHLLVREECNISGQHDDSGLVFSHKHFESVCLRGLVPLHVYKVGVKRIVKVKRSGGPWPNEARSVTVAHADGVSTGKSNDFLV
jgi:hypothetical protein